MGNKPKILNLQGKPITSPSSLKVVIGVPSTDRVIIPYTAHSIGCAIIGADGLVVDFILQLSCDIASSRTNIVRQALTKNATHLLFVDADMVFPKDTIPKLLAHDKDIIGVRYNRRRFPIEKTWQVADGATESDTEPYRVRHCGTGLMLIKLSIFEKPWKSPWFNFGRDSEGNLKIGEDAWFCYAAQDEGFEVWIDPSLKIGHSGEYIY